MKEANLKIWPEIINYQSAIVPFEKTNDQRNNDIYIDFTNCIKVDSTGLTILLVDLIKLFQKDSRAWTIAIEDSSIKDALKNLGVFNIIDQYSGKKNLFWDNSLIVKEPKPIYYKNGDLEVYSYPIYQIDFNSLTDRREALESFRRYISTNLKDIFREFDLKIHFVLAVLQEIAKNSADHTTDNAFFGLDVIIDSSKSLLKVQFAYGDLGKGIHSSIKDYINKNDANYKARAKKMALSDSYHYALKTGFTTKPDTKKNKGMGMTLIVEASTGLNLNLSVFDANSRFLINKAIENTHAELRKYIYDTGRSVGFYYYGELSCLKKDSNEKNFYI